jgi:hypothetical protein
MGRIDEIAFLVDVDLTGPQREDLYLGFIKKQYFFIFPCGLFKGDYVLGVVSGSSTGPSEADLAAARAMTAMNGMQVPDEKVRSLAKMAEMDRKMREGLARIEDGQKPDERDQETVYFDMPKGEHLASLQQRGLLPSPLPQKTISMRERIWGSFILLVIAGLCIAFAPYYLIGRRSGRSTVSTASQAGQDASGSLHEAPGRGTPAPESSGADQPVARAAIVASGDAVSDPPDLIQSCPQCGVRVLPMSDGACPSCRKSMKP